jgi:hypothetical protein
LVRRYEKKDEVLYSGESEDQMKLPVDSIGHWSANEILDALQNQFHDAPLVNRKIANMCSDGVIFRISPWCQVGR